MQKFFQILFVGFLGGIVVQQLQETSVEIDDVLLENVEALAGTESTLPITCIGEGGVTCPNNGKKVLEVYEGYSLGLDEETY